MSEKQIPLLDLQAQHEQIRDEVLAEIVRVVDSQKFILGEDVKKLEAEIAAYSGTKHAIGCASGSDALMLAMMALDVQPGDEVLTTPYTFFATAGAISLVGAVPVFVDVEEDTFNLDVSLMERGAGGASESSRDHSGALVRRLCRHGPHHEMANERGIPVIEDAAQSIGSEYKRPAGRQHRQDRRFQLFPEQEPGRLRRRRDHDDGRCSARREADGAAGSRPHRKILSPVDRRQLAAGYIAGGGVASQAAASGRMVGGAGAKCGTLSHAVGETRSSRDPGDAGRIPDASRLQPVRDSLRSSATLCRTHLKGQGNRVRESIIPFRCTCSRAMRIWAIRRAISR